MIHFQDCQRTLISLEKLTQTYEFRNYSQMSFNYLVPEFWAEELKRKHHYCILYWLFGIRNYLVQHLIFLKEGLVQAKFSHITWFFVEWSLSKFTPNNNMKELLLKNSSHYRVIIFLCFGDYWVLLVNLWRSMSN